MKKVKSLINDAQNKAISLNHQQVLPEHLSLFYSFRKSIILFYKSLKKLILII